MTYDQALELWVPLDFFLSIVLVSLIVWVAWCIIIKPFLRG